METAETVETVAIVETVVIVETVAIRETSIFSEMFNQMVSHARQLSTLECVALQ